MSVHRYDIRISEGCVDPNPLMVERQDPDNFTRFQTRERCAFEIAAYVFKPNVLIEIVAMGHIDRNTVFRRIISVYILLPVMA